MIGMAVVGCAHIHTPGFVKRLKERASVKVLRVWDHDAARGQANAEQLGSQATSDVRAIWGDKAIDAVVICSETNRHEELVMAAAAAGKHMFVEKPLGFASQDAFRMAAAIEKAGVIFQTGYFMRGSPVHLFLKEQIAAGAFGQITRARHSNCHKGSLGGWFDKEWRWMADPGIAGCGAYGDLGTHSLDILMWLLGDVARVTASIRTVTRRYGDCDESGEGLLEFANGVIATLAAGWVDVANPVSVLVSGTQGHAFVSGGQLFFQSERVEGADGKAPWTKLPAALPHAFELFLDTLEGKTGLPLVTVREAADRSAVMEALYAGAREHAWVTPRSNKS
jgi:predicted dehydrogenase